MLTESKLANIIYESSTGGKTTDRTIVPVTVPGDSVRAIDVSELDDARRNEMAALVAEYKSYMDTVYKAAFSFENWVEHTYMCKIEPKWRSFKTANITDRT